MSFGVGPTWRRGKVSRRLRVRFIFLPFQIKYRNRNRKIAVGITQTFDQGPGLPSRGSQALACRLAAKRRNVWSILLLRRCCGGFRLG